MTAVSPVRTRCPASLIAAIRSATGQHADWQQTADLVAAQVRRHLPRAAELLTDSEREGDPADYQCHVLHVEPDGTFSVTAMVWRPGQLSPIHDHVAWCVFGVLQGVEYEELFALAADGSHLLDVGRNENRPGDVSGFAPPGDIHRVRNTGDSVAISLNVYGADITRLGSSLRRAYDVPVLVPAAR
ncbi:MAG TPA: cysteine dioxygenase family protein [Streptosporangiaceae bacterium]|jgi:predicted metal-dependent enzyme (double-stranded beta helix superfamily)